MGVDRFGNPHAPNLPYTRGEILSSTEDDFVKLQRAWSLIRERGPSSTYISTGLEHSLPLAIDELPFAARTPLILSKKLARAAAMVAAVGLLPLFPVKAADPEIDKLLQSPVGKDWVTNGGNITNQRYSTLKQIDTGNAKQLKGTWMTRLKGSGFGGKYSGEATPLVKAESCMSSPAMTTSSH